MFAKFIWVSVVYVLHESVKDVASCELLSYLALQNWNPRTISIFIRGFQKPGEWPYGKGSKKIVWPYRSLYKETLGLTRTELHQEIKCRHSSECHFLKKHHHSRTKDMRSKSSFFGKRHQLSHVQISLWTRMSSISHCMHVCIFFSLSTSSIHIFLLRVNNFSSVLSQYTPVIKSIYWSKFMEVILKWKWRWNDFNLHVII